jgi:uncharacterized protein YfbU (UPF0304 family)
MNLSNGEKLILIMLTEVYKKLEIKGDVDPDFVQEAIFSGNTWGLKSKHSGIFVTDEDNPEVRKEVIDILAMWSILESSYERLSPEDKELIKVEAQPFGNDVKFRGFDGNNEGSYMGIASFVINHLDRFTEFKGRDLNSHYESLDGYRRMCSVYDPMVVASGRDLSANQIIEIIKEQYSL